MNRESSLLRGGLRAAMVMEAFDRNSATKSLSEVASRLFAEIFEKPSSFAMAWRSRAKLEPATAPDPRGSTLTRLSDSSKRS